MSKSRKKHATIDEYLADFPKEVQEILQKIRKLIKETAPDAQEAISYQMPTFKLKKKNMVHFAAFQKHIGLYPTPDGIQPFQEKLNQYHFSKGAIQFPLNQPIPYDLIKEIVKYRAKSMESA